MSMTAAAPTNWPAQQSEDSTIVYTTAQVGLGTTNYKQSWDSTPSELYVTGEPTGEPETTTGAVSNQETSSEPETTSETKQQVKLSVNQKQQVNLLVNQKQQVKLSVNQKQQVKLSVNQKQQVKLSVNQKRQAEQLVSQRQQNQKRHQTLKSIQWLSLRPQALNRKVDKKDLHKLSAKELSFIKVKPTEEFLNEFDYEQRKFHNYFFLSSSACYLAPAGLVYATSFGFAFQQALNKQHDILNQLAKEIGKIDHIATFAAKLTTVGIVDRLNIIKAVKDETIFMVLQILEREPHTFHHTSPKDVRVSIWDILDVLRKVDTSKDNCVNRILCKHIVEDIKDLNSICSDRISIMHARIHPVMWLFLETLGFFSFLGILLLTAFSYRMELLMCIVTVFSISLLCYVVSDLDSPFSGFFRVNTKVIEDLLSRLTAMYEMAKLGQVEIFYPNVRATHTGI
ncbi:uncharacterized protein LOC101858840 [Aplysia californica]|uniref:Uncharacterized protein LOC101858840 n=1 Tax=Aplysia californica TaxID=6500 RepID=A0ABM1AFV2_APLCA|nr:uncharacterized protein LOC101858840 [Aplysia californica]